MRNRTDGSFIFNYIYPIIFSRKSQIRKNAAQFPGRLVCILGIIVFWG